MKRRNFLALGISSLPLMKTTLVSGASPRGARSNVKKLEEPSKRPGALPARLGTYYESTVPDTLDLAERALAGLHYFDSITDADLNYEMYFGFEFRTLPPSIYAHMSSLPCCSPKALEAIAFERLMTGSSQNLDREAKMVDMMVSMLGEDGLYWVSADLTKKPWMKIPEPFVYVHGQGRMMRAMIAWYQYTGDSAWARRIDRMVDGIDRKLAVHKDDYAYIPAYGFYQEEYLRSCYTRKGWKDTTEPLNEKAGEEGSLFNHQGNIPGALANWYVLSGNEQALSLSGQLVRFYTKPKFWADWKDGEYPGVDGAEHAHWQGHFHGHINTLRAILEYAIAANDAQLKQFVREGYEWARQIGCARIGYFDRQGCACGRIIGLAVKLSYHGVGDYWEDVDQYIRNHGTEMQVLPEDVKFLNSLSEKNPAPKNYSDWAGFSEIITDHVADRFVGGYGGWLDKSAGLLCCGTHGNMGLFYAWDGIVRHQDGTAQVNLLLNRASPWLDIDSHLPYEGKVVVRNKAAHEIFVRIPLWVDRKAVRCTVGPKEVPNVWFGNRLRFSELQPGDVLTIQFPMVEKTEEWLVLRIDCREGPEKQVHTCKFKGNTLVEISPPLKGNTLGEISPPLVPSSPLYQRSYFLKNTAPMKKITRFVSPLTLKW